MADPRMNIQITAEDMTAAVMRGIQDGFKRVEAGIKQSTRATKESKQAFDTSSLSLDGLVSRYGAVAAAATTYGAAITKSIQAAMGMEKIEAMLRSSTGSAQAGGLAFQFIADEAKRLGLDIQTSAQSFAKFNASARGTSLEGEGVQKVFSGVAEAGAAMKLSTAEMDGVLLALSQMMSKGTVQAEELRGQLGERLPGAYKLAAEAMGLTEQQLGKQLELGQIMATDMLPKLADKLHEVYGSSAQQAAQQTAAEFARVKNEVFLNAAAFGKDLLPAVSVVLKLMSAGIEVVGAMIKIFKDLASTVFAAGFAMAEFAKLTVGGGWFSAEGRAAFIDGMRNIKEALLAQYDDMGEASAKYNLTEQQRANEKARNDQRRLEESAKAAAANKKTTDDYNKLIIGQEERLTAQFKEEYDKKYGIVKAYFEGRKKAVAAGSAEELNIQNQYKDALAKLERERSAQGALVALETRRDALKAQQELFNEEIAAVEEKVAKGVLSETRGAAIISGLKVKQAKDEYDLAQQRVSVLTVAGQQGTEAYAKSLADMRKAHEAYLRESTAAYKQYAGNIKAIDAEIKSYRDSMQSKIADIQQKAMTEGQKYADNQLRYDQAISKARAALAAKDYDLAQKYNQQAEEMASRLVDKQAAGNTELEKQQALKEGVASATAALNQVEGLGLEILQAKKQENQDALAKLQEIQKMKLDPKSLQINMDQGALSAVQSQLEALTATSTKIINVVYRSTGSSGEASYSDTPGYFEGGKIGVGSSLRDSVHAMLAKGEWVINNTATRFWGDGLMAAINAPFSAAGQKLQQALQFSGPAPAAATPMGSIDLNIGGGSYAMQAPVNVLGELTTALRRMKMTRQQ